MASSKMDTRSLVPDFEALLPVNSSEKIMKRGPKSKGTKHFKDQLPQRFVKSSPTTETDLVCLDHSYSKSWNSQSDQSLARNAIYLSWSKPFQKKVESRVPSESNIPLAAATKPDSDLIDVESFDEIAEVGYSVEKAEVAMRECERHVKIARPGHSQGSQDETINRVGWTTIQHKLFNRVYKTLMGARLARLSYTEQVNETLRRRVSSDKCARRIRQIFSGVLWDMKLLRWLHSVLMNSLSITMLPDYIEALQTLKAKNSELIDKIVEGSDHNLNANDQMREAFSFLLQRPWDPINPSIGSTKLEKLPRNPYIILVPMIPYMDKRAVMLKSRRIKHWNSQLSAMGKLVQIPPLASQSKDMWKDFDLLVTSIRTKILEVKCTNPNKPVVLIGWRFGALLATYVAALERVEAAVALGFPFIGIKGIRGDADDIILDSTTPTLFVVGEYAQSCPITDLEDLRERMRVQNGLIVVQGASDKLIVNTKTKKKEGITQPVVDERIQQELYSFLAQAVTTCHVPVAPKPRPPAVETPLDGTITVGTNQTPPPSKLKKYKKKLADSVQTTTAIDQVDITTPSYHPVMKKPKISTIKQAKKSIKRIGTTGFGAILDPYRPSFSTLTNLPHTSPSETPALSTAPSTPMARPNFHVRDMPKESSSFVQITGKHGPSYSIPLEKAKRLFNLSEMKTMLGIDPSKLVSIPTSLLSHFTNISQSEDRNTDKFRASTAQKKVNQPTNPSRPAAAPKESVNSAQHIRHLLSTGATAAQRFRTSGSDTSISNISGSTTTISPTSAQGGDSHTAINSSSDQSAASLCSTGKIVQNLTSSVTSSPSGLLTVGGQSLIRRLQDSTSTTRSIPFIQPKIIDVSAPTPPRQKISSGQKFVIPASHEGRKMFVTPSSPGATVSVTMSVSQPLRYIGKPVLPNQTSTNSLSSNDGVRYIHTASVARTNAPIIRNIHSPTVELVKPVKEVKLQLQTTSQNLIQESTTCKANDDEIFPPLAHEIVSSAKQSHSTAPAAQPANVILSTPKPVIVSTPGFTSSTAISPSGRPTNEQASHARSTNEKVSGSKLAPQIREEPPPDILIIPEDECEILL